MHQMSDEQAKRLVHVWYTVPLRHLRTKCGSWKKATDLHPTLTHRWEANRHSQLISVHAQNRKDTQGFRTEANF